MVGRHAKKTLCLHNYRILNQVTNHHQTKHPRPYPILARYSNARFKMSSEQFNLNLEKIDTQMGELLSYVLSPYHTHPSYSVHKGRPLIYRHMRTTPTQTLKPHLTVILTNKNQSLRSPPQNATPNPKPHHVLHLRLPPQHPPPTPRHRR